MNELIDKLVVFTLCITLFLLDKNYPITVVPFIASIITTCLSSYFESKNVKVALLVLYTIAAMWVPSLVIFIPLICYDLFVLSDQWLCLLLIIPLLFHFNSENLLCFVLLLLFTGICYLIKHRTVNGNESSLDYKKLRDTTEEISRKFEAKNKELLDKQDYEINLATLNERNRIAREIHDNVGHLLSSSILQLGALLAINKDAQMKDGLVTLKDTLSVGMNSIRNSVHNLHEESIDLYMEIEALINNFSFCECQLDYDIKNIPDRKLTYCFIAIVKEALSNVMKHSNATYLTLTLREHPALYQLIITDNGDVKNYNIYNGIGLNNITDRVNSFNGNINISVDNGFKIFISIPNDKKGKV